MTDLHERLKSSLLPICNEAADEIERLRAERNDLAVDRVKLGVELTQTRRERDALRGQVKAYRDDVAKEVEANAVSIATVHRLRAKWIAWNEDAERYKWLRDVGNANWTPLAKRPSFNFTHEVDAAIDAARKGER